MKISEIFDFVETGSECEWKMVLKSNTIIIEAVVIQK